MGALSMDEQHRADGKLERELRELSRRLDALNLWGRVAGTGLGSDCHVLARKLRDEADHIVRVWD